MEIFTPSSTYHSSTGKSPLNAKAEWKDLRDTLEGRGFSKRGPLGDIKRLFPGITIPAETTENDDLWIELGGKETLNHLKERVDGIFNKIWDMAVDDDCTLLTPANAD